MEMSVRSYLVKKLQNYVDEGYLVSKYLKNGLRVSLFPIYKPLL